MTFRSKDIVYKNGRFVLKKSKPAVIHRAIGIIPDDIIERTFEKYLKQNGVYIPYNVASKKNSRIFSFVGRPGYKVPKLIYSEAYQKYLKLSSSYWEKGAKYFRELSKDKDMPLEVYFLLIRSSEAIFDYNNIIQGPADLMVKYEWIKDDNAKVFLPFNKKYIVNKQAPGIVVFV